MMRASPRRLPTALWLWMLAAVLVLKASVPMLASMAAERQGVTLVEVCSVYGMRLVALPSTGEDEAPASTVMAGNAEHCALGALATAAGPQPLGTDFAPLRGSRCEPVAPKTEASVPDACQRWLALRVHAPPAVS